MPVHYVIYVGIVVIVGNNRNISGKQKHLGFKQYENEMCCLVLEKQRKCKGCGSILYCCPQSLFCKNKNSELK